VSGNMGWRNFYIHPYRVWCILEFSCQPWTQSSHFE